MLMASRSNVKYRGEADSHDLWNTLRDTKYLDNALEQIRAREVPQALEYLNKHLYARKLSFGHFWKNHIVDCRAHPLKALLYEDPFTAHAFRKPRGYPGDAELLDLIYKPGTHTAKGPVGQSIYEWNVMRPAPCAVRSRRTLVSSAVEKCASTVEFPSILSIASGHLREAELCTALVERRIGKFVAFDHDAKSLAIVEKQYSKLGVNTVRGTVKELLGRNLHLGDFDLIYTLGIFDYLGQKLAQTLLRVMFAMLKPGGKCLIANFLPEQPDVGYMEAFMDWHLVYRSKEDILALVDQIPSCDVQSVTAFEDDHKSTAFLEIEKIAEVRNGATQIDHHFEQTG